jgi:hypothetical protein
MCFARKCRRRCYVLLEVEGSRGHQMKASLDWQGESFWSVKAEDVSQKHSTKRYLKNAVSLPARVSVSLEAL